MQDVNYCQEPAISNRMTASRNKRTLEWPVWDVCARPLTANLASGSALRALEPKG
jgi:hypothetical protein